MKERTFTSKEVAEWLAVFHAFDTKEEYQNKLHACRCLFHADEDPEFWSEVCKEAKFLIDNK